ncbi:hypothetical protein ACFHWD_18685 [Clostridium sp. MT-14]|jgi:hypothetical protein|uniref:hypothetical protein n=1 Tax=unclassified Clostridium TaxID=2614128 RepID=UPI00123B4A4E|nr:hypothetical protein [Clostridium sp. HV4-5-A1G]KAA8668993.1 hypothetical protein F3O63_13760 [Clostridium sp. HV4-5-A1G]CAB1249703.1 hypothetical protein CLOSBL3_11933 [Clostridiaceae bacterium BL-3]
MENKEFEKLEKENEYLKELLREALGFIDGYRDEAGYWEHMYNLSITNRSKDISNRVSGKITILKRSRVRI